MSKRIGLLANCVVICLTICQLAHAAPERAKAKKRVARASRSSYDSEMRSSTKRRKLTIREEIEYELSTFGRSNTLTGFGHSVAVSIPEDGRVIMEGNFGGSLVKSKGSGTIPGGTQVNVESDARGFNSGIAASYGLTSFLYFGTSLHYTSNSSDTTISANSAGQSGRSSSKSNGISEPNVKVGLHRLVGRVRLVSELSFQIPLGESKTKYSGTTSGTNSESDGLHGGWSVTPAIGAIADFGTVRLIGNIGYEINGEHRNTTEQTGSLPHTTTTTGGNTISVSSAIEFPRALNMGVATSYHYTLERESTTVGSALPATPSSKSEPSQTIAGGVYMGIPVNEDFVIMPRAIYTTPLKRESGGVTLQQADVGLADLTAKFSF